ncbi:MAG: hypothetical protein GY751_20095 [Bacteroidetes bacterium]|nr:hypothetical protein [Bacteroidota bacterium]
MKVIVVGGAGEMGRRTVEDLAYSPNITHLTVADINYKEAQNITRDLVATNVEIYPKELDALQHDYLVEVISDHDLVVSSIGPYNVFEERMVEACIEAGVDYLSICDEWDVVHKVTRKYDEPAREKGIKIICGMGASPGITNIAAKHLADQMDKVDKIDISVWLPLDTGAGKAAIEHGINIMTGDMMVWRKGRKHLIQACTETVSKEFPAGIGTEELWNMGHSEPVTLPRAISGVNEVNFYMGFGLGSFLLTGPARLGWFGIDSVRNVLTSAFVTAEKAMSKRTVRKGASRVDVWGEKDEQPIQLTAYGSTTMQESTALALAVGTEMIASGDILVDRGGVYAPEQVFHPGLCLRRLDLKGISVFTDMGMTEKIV